MHLGSFNAKAVAYFEAQQKNTIELLAFLQGMQLHLHVACKYISFCGHMIYLSRCAILWLSNATRGMLRGRCHFWAAVLWQTDEISVAQFAWLLWLGVCLLQFKWLSRLASFISLSLSLCLTALLLSSFHSLCLSAPLNPYQFAQFDYLNLRHELCTLNFANLMRHVAWNIFVRDRDRYREGDGGPWLGKTFPLPVGISLMRPIH